MGHFSEKEKRWNQLSRKSRRRQPTNGTSEQPQQTTHHPLQWILPLTSFAFLMIKRSMEKDHSPVYSALLSANQESPPPMSWRDTKNHNRHHVTMTATRRPYADNNLTWSRCGTSTS